MYGCPEGVSKLNIMHIYKSQVAHIHGPYRTNTYFFTNALIWSILQNRTMDLFNACRLCSVWVESYIYPI